MFFFVFIILPYLVELVRIIASIKNLASHVYLFLNIVTTGILLVQVPKLLREEHEMIPTCEQLLDAAGRTTVSQS